MNRRGWTQGTGGKEPNPPRLPTQVPKPPKTGGSGPKTKPGGFGKPSTSGN